MRKTYLKPETKWLSCTAEEVLAAESLPGDPKDDVIIGAKEWEQPEEDERKSVWDQ